LGDIWRGCVTLATPAALKDELTACMYHGANDRARARHATQTSSTMYMYLPATATATGVALQIIERTCLTDTGHGPYRPRTYLHFAS